MTPEQRYNFIMKEVKSGVIMKSGMSGQVHSYNILQNPKYSKLSDIK